MRTDDFRPSENVEDDREAIASRGIPGGCWDWFRKGVGRGPGAGIGVREPVMLREGKHAGIGFSERQIRGFFAPLSRKTPSAVIPAKAGIQRWTPAYAGVTEWRLFITFGGPQAHGNLRNDKFPLSSPAY